MLGLGVIAVIPALAGCGPDESADEAQPQSAEHVVRIEAGAAGFTPDRIELAADEPAVLEFVRTAEQTCATAVVFAESGIRHELPLNEPVRVTVRPSAGQEIAFACPMDMYRGSVGAAMKAQTDDVGVAVDGIVAISVDQQGFHPARIQVPKGESTVLRFTRVAEKTCNTGVLIPSLGIDETFPLNKAVDVTIAPDAAGEIAFSCPMNMSTGLIEVLAGEEQ
jgi:plastocyanin domain-containing protein